MSSYSFLGLKAHQLTNTGRYSQRHVLHRCLSWEWVLDQKLGNTVRISVWCHILYFVLTFSGKINSRSPKILFFFSLPKQLRSYSSVARSFHSATWEEKGSKVVRHVVMWRDGGGKQAVECDGAVIIMRPGPVTLAFGQPCGHCNFGFMPFSTGISLPLCMISGDLCSHLSTLLFFWVSFWGANSANVPEYASWMKVKNSCRLECSWCGVSWLQYLSGKDGWDCTELNPVGLFPHHCWACGNQVGVWVGVRTFWTLTLSCLTHSYCALTVVFRINYPSLLLSCPFTFIPVKFRGKDLTTILLSLLLTPP